MTGDPLTAVLDQLAAHREQLAGLDAREARHLAGLAGQLARLATAITAAGQALAGDTTALARIGARERAVDGLDAAICCDPATAIRLTGHAAGRDMELE